MAIESHEEKLNFTCYESVTNTTYLIFFNAHFWLDGVGIIVVGTFGFVGNIMTILVLRRIDTNVMFNRLLLSLGKIFFVKSSRIGPLP